jgi:hypothetical protein
VIVAEQRAFFYPRLEKLAIVLKENGFNDNDDNIDDSLSRRKSYFILLGCTMSKRICRESEFF